MSCEKKILWTSTKINKKKKKTQSGNIHFCVESHQAQMNTILFLIFILVDCLKIEYRWTVLPHVIQTHAKWDQICYFIFSLNSQNNYFNSLYIFICLLCKRILKAVQFAYTANRNMNMLHGLENS